jgi:hypothetical protein
VTDAILDAPATLPVVSVVLATYQGADRIGTCLDSLFAQTLAPELYEIVVVQNGPACATPEVVIAAQERHPAHTVRLLETDEPGAANARNIGIDAARGLHLTIVDDDDWVSPRYLEALLEHARFGVVPAVLMCDIAADAAPGSTSGSLENYYSARLLPFAGRLVDPAEVPTTMSLHAGKLLPTDLAREVRYDTSLRSGEDLVFLAGLQALSPHMVEIVGPETGALYYRSLRAGSVSRRELDYGFAVQERLDCIAALCRIEGPEDRLADSAADVIEALVRAQTDFTVRYLAEHPEAYDAVAADARARGIRTPTFWSTVNRGRARDLALLYLFPPYQDTSALVAARRLRARGRITDVINQSFDNARDIDPGSLMVAADYVGEHLVLPGVGSFVSWPLTVQWTERSVARAEDLARRRGTPYETVYTRAMAPQSHFAGALMKLRHPEIRWTAEFSDPLHYNAYGEIRAGEVEDDELLGTLSDGILAAGFDKPTSVRLFEWAEILAYALADEIVFTNESQRRFMLEYTSDRALAARAEAISTVSHHPTLPREFYEIADFDLHLSPDTINVGYFGAFYLTRGLTEVTSALLHLSAEERRRFRLHVYTSDPARLRVEALRAGLADLIVPHHYLPFLQFLAATTHFDALLVNDADTGQHHATNPYLPSKISDYRGSGSPVWSIVEPGSVLSSMDTTYRSLLGDSDGALQVIRSIIAAGPQHRG